MFRGFTRAYDSLIAFGNFYIREWMKFLVQTNQLVPIGYLLKMIFYLQEEKKNSSVNS